LRFDHLSLVPQEMTMGMFDDIRCTAKLPQIGPDPGTRDFQTKDFDCARDQYYITSDGCLFKGRELIAFHGLLRFNHFDTKIDTWWEYEAKFTDSALIEIKPVEIRKLVGKYPNIEYHYYFYARRDKGQP
jgi:hypothetical protein